MATKLSSPQAFRHMVMTVVAVVVAPFFAAIIIATRQMVRASRPSNLLHSPEQVGVVDLPPFVAQECGQHVVGMVKDVAGVVGAVANVGEELIDTDWICAFSMVVAAKLLKPVVQVVWPTMNVRSSATTAKSGMMTI